MPTFNREAHIGLCLESIAQQGRTDTEVIVVDNASSDDTVEIVQNFRDLSHLTVLVNDSNRERSYSRNRGALEASGHFLVFLDSDDQLTPTALQQAATYCEANSGYRFFFQLITIVNELGRTVYEPTLHKRYSIRRTLAEGNPLSCSGVFVERSLFLQFLFDENPRLIGSEDWHCWIRIATEVEPTLCPGGGALLVDHGSRTAANEPWQEMERRFAYQTADLLSSPQTANYLSPFRDNFLGSQSHYVAVRAAAQSAIRPSLRHFARAMRRYPRLLFTRRTAHLCRLWLRGLT